MKINKSSRSLVLGRSVNDAACPSGFRSRGYAH
jgi:hypothetical protein